MRVCTNEGVQNHLAEKTKLPSTDQSSTILEHRPQTFTVHLRGDGADLQIVLPLPVFRWYRDLPLRKREKNIKRKVFRSTDAGCSSRYTRRHGGGKTSRSQGVNLLESHTRGATRRRKGQREKNHINHITAPARRPHIPCPWDAIPSMRILLPHPS